MFILFTICYKIYNYTLTFLIFFLFLIFPPPFLCANCSSTLNARATPNPDSFPLKHVRSCRYRYGLVTVLKALLLNNLAFSGRLTTIDIAGFSRYRFFISISFKSWSRIRLLKTGSHRHMDINRPLVLAVLNKNSRSRNLEWKQISTQIKSNQITLTWMCRRPPPLVGFQSLVGPPGRRMERFGTRNLTSWCLL